MVNEDKDDTRVEKNKEEDEDNDEKEKGKIDDEKKGKEEAPRSARKKRRRSDGRDDENGPIPADDHLRDFKMISFRAADVNAHLVCRLCEGYFRDAHTITECLHTFCKQCLITYLRSGKGVCPHCNVFLGPHPQNVILHDRTMQTLVDKIFPIEKQTAPSLATTTAKATTEKQPSSPQKKTQAKDVTDQISFKVEPHNQQDANHPLQALDKPYLKTSGKLKVLQLRKYLAKKLNTNSNNLELLCKDQTLPAEHSVQFIKRMMWFPSNDIGDLLLTYRKNDAILDVI
uniref:RING-type domain-containing protein n=1 Tax=Aureoumbra lagunensis TaxID=44058 RepID=A0A7S3K0S2_9STRA|mmetsp:Transcript_22369/g.28949  ORF Transcript_22369/g.28949 Transcript_22369/m.28949 type:complete len:286 (+) Transcript_22369:63-920(+)